MLPIEVRQLVTEDFDRYFRLRLAGLVERPAAFTTDADSWRNAERSTLESQLSPERSDSPVIGAWVGARELIGLVGMNREQRRSVAHKAGLWGLYVSPSYRRHGVGRRLVEALIAQAERQPGLRQFRAVVPTSCVEALALLGALGFESYGLERAGRLVGGTFHDQSYLAYFIKELDPGEGGHP